MSNLLAIKRRKPTSDDAPKPIPEEKFKDSRPHLDILVDQYEALRSVVINPDAAPLEGDFDNYTRPDEEALNYYAQTAAKIQRRKNRSRALKDKRNSPHQIKDALNKERYDWHIAQFITTSNSIHLEKAKKYAKNPAQERQLAILNQSAIADSKLKDSRPARPTKVAAPKVQETPASNTGGSGTILATSRRKPAPKTPADTPKPSRRKGALVISG